MNEWKWESWPIRFDEYYKWQQTQYLLGRGVSSASPHFVYYIYSSNCVLHNRQLWLAMHSALRISLACMWQYHFSLLTPPHFYITKSVSKWTVQHCSHCIWSCSQPTQHACILVWQFVPSYVAQPLLCSSWNTTTTHLIVTPSLYVLLARFRNDIQSGHFPLSFPFRIPKFH